MPIHYRYGGSTAARTLACPAWHALSDGMPKAAPSLAARQGTALHKVIELCLLDLDRDPRTFDGETVEGVRLNRQLIETKIIPALDDFDVLFEDYDIGDYYAELTASISPSIGGTADFVGLSYDRTTLVIADYKSGSGTMVYAYENAQGLFYAMCIMCSDAHRHLFDEVDRVVIAIVQPSDRRADTLDVWETVPSRINKFHADYMDAVQRAEKNNTVPSMGDHCRYCPAESIRCTAKKDAALAAQTLPINSVDVKNLSQAMALADALEPWIKSVRTLAHSTLERGTPIDGYKLVAKRATRVWNDEGSVRGLVKNSKRLLLEDAYEVKLRSPAQIEKLCKAHDVDFSRFADYVSSVSKGTTLVADTDARPEVIVSDARQILENRFF